MVRDGSTPKCRSFFTPLLLVEQKGDKDIDIQSEMRRVRLEWLSCVMRKNRRLSD